MKSIKIEVPEGYIIDEVNSTFEKILFKEIDKPIIERVRTFSDVCKILGKKESDFELGKNEDESDAAMRKLKAVTKVLNENYELDWSDGNEYKYIPYFTIKDGAQVFNCVGDWSTRADVPASLYYRSRELANYAGNQFLDIYRKAFQL